MSKTTTFGAGVLLIAAVAAGKLLLKAGAFGLGYVGGHMAVDAMNNTPPTEHSLEAELVELRQTLPIEADEITQITDIQGDWDAKCLTYSGKVDVNEPINSLLVSADYKTGGVSALCELPEVRTYLDFGFVFVYDFATTVGDKIYYEVRDEDCGEEEV